MNERPPNISEYSNKLQALYDRINSEVASRVPAGISPTLIAVSKGHSSLAIRELYHLGVRHFAESYVQEFLKKFDELSDIRDISWHFVGVLQSNKAKKIISTRCLIHSLDRVSLFEALSKTARPELPLQVLVQLQVDPLDLNKSGCTFEEARRLCSLLVKNPGFDWQGFMGIGPYGKPNEVLKSLYGEFAAQARELWEEFSLRDPSREMRPMKLSLGMSDDLETALQAGSTHLRIGTALFGERPHKG
jgi:PLP dependent protein